MSSSSTSSSHCDAVPVPLAAFSESLELLDDFEAAFAPLDALETLLPPPQSPIPLAIDSSSSSPTSSSSPASSPSNASESPCGSASPLFNHPTHANASSSRAVASSRKRRNSTRDRENAERLELRRQIEQLEALLTELKRRSNGSAGTQAKKRAIVLWKRLAERQRLARRCAETTKAEMTKRAEENADWIRRLQALLLERKKREGLLSYDWVRRSTWEDILVFANLKQELWEAYSRVDQVLDTTGLARVLAARCEEEWVPTVDEWFRVEANASGSTVVCARYLPFATAPIVAAVWEVLSCIRGAHEAGGLDADGSGSMWDAHTNEASDTDCSLKLQGRVIAANDNIISDSSIEQANYRAVAKRFDVDRGTSNRDARKVVVSRSLIQSGDNGARRSVSTMWIVLTPCSQTGEGASILSIVAHLQGNDLDIGGPPVSGRLTQSCIRGLLARVEGDLLDQDLPAIPPSASSTNIQYASV